MVLERKRTTKENGIEHTKGLSLAIMEELGLKYMLPYKTDEVT